MIIERSAGAVEYITVNIAELSGQDLDGITVDLSLGGRSAPGTWINADTTVVGRQASAKILINSQSVVSNGSYYVWVKVTDVPEIIIFPVQGQTVTIR